jgi:rod shape-determining protein MreC
MGKLLAFFRRNSVELLFIGLQVISLMLLINAKSFHRSKWNDATARLNARIIDARSQLNNYLSLRSQNEVLQRENARLKSLTQDMFVLDAPVYFPLNSALFEQQYRLFPGQAINRSYRKTNNALLIDKGERHGVYRGMAVMGPNGVVGIVKDVYPRYATALAIIHSSVRLSVALQKNNYFGTLTWDGRDHRFGQITDLPSHAIIDIGDTVVTDTRSSIFPPGMVVGIVDALEYNTVGDYIHAQVQFTTDFSAIRAVYMVEDLRADELQHIENQTSDE